MHRIQLLTAFGLFLTWQSVFGQEVVGPPISPQVGPGFYPPPPQAGQYLVPPQYPVPQYTVPPQSPPNPSSTVSPGAPGFTPPPLAPGGTMPLVAPLPSVEPSPAPPPKLWEGSVELGVAGNEGNSPTFNIHFGAKLKRKTEFDVLSSELNYHENAGNSTVTANRGLLDSRFEHLFQDSAWTWFVHNEVDYDEFKAYHMKDSLDAGFGYRLVKNDAASLTAPSAAAKPGNLRTPTRATSTLTKLFSAWRANTRSASGRSSRLRSSTGPTSPTSPITA